MSNGWLCYRKATEDDLRLINQKAQEFIQRNQLEDWMPEESGSPLFRLEGLLWYPGYHWFPVSYYRGLWHRILKRAFGSNVQGVAYGYLGRPDHG